MDRETRKKSRNSGSSLSADEFGKCNLPLPGGVKTVKVVCIFQRCRVVSSMWQITLLHGNGFIVSCEKTGERSIFFNHCAACTSCYCNCDYLRDSPLSGWSFLKQPGYTVSSCMILTWKDEIMQRWNVHGLFVKSLTTMRVSRAYCVYCPE